MSALGRVAPPSRQTVMNAERALEERQPFGELGFLPLALCGQRVEGAVDDLWEGRVGGRALGRSGVGGGIRIGSRRRPLGSVGRRWPDHLRPIASDLK